jgi:hypothetical protein
MAGKNPIAAGNFSWIFARDCEGTEQLRTSAAPESACHKDKIECLFDICLASGSLIC